MELTPELRRLFAKAGWHDDWHFHVPGHISCNHPAYSLLQTFGGIHVKPRSITGRECATADIQFEPLDHRWDIVDTWQSLLCTQLIGCGLASETHEQLWVASDNRFFSSNDVTDDFGFVGEGFSDAISNLLLGVRHRPLIPPGKSSMQYYGEIYLKDDPRIYQWENHGDNQMLD